MKLKKNVDILKYDLKMLCELFNEEKKKWWLNSNAELVLSDGVNPIERYLQILDKKREIDYWEKENEDPSIEL